MVKYVVICVAIIIGSWLLFDGSRALITGSYTTPQSGPYAGQLGLWSHLVTAIGLDPLGTFVKALHVALGLSWVLCGVLLMRNSSAAWWPLMLTALLSLWYLPFGTIAGLIVVGSLLLQSMRHAA